MRLVRLFGLLALAAAYSSPRPSLEQQPRLSREPIIAGANGSAPTNAASIGMLPATDALATDELSSPAASPASAASRITNDVFVQQALLKQLTDDSFVEQLGGEMIVRKVRYPGADDMLIPAYLFAPNDTTVLHPAIIVVHGGIHADFDEFHIPQVRSLVRQGYIIVAPEYRGSTGYGREHYDAIDYGGKEVEDCIAAREYMAAHVANADLSRLAIMGWSHGGFITLHAILRRPELFKVAVAHVPVADLPIRIRTHSESYHDLFARQKGFGGRLEQNPLPYIERSPIAHARKLKTPLLVHAADNDDDVLIIENRNLQDSMRVAGMERTGLFTYREWHDPPGGHGFNRVNTPEGRESWAETLAFLGRYLSLHASRGRHATN